MEKEIIKSLITTLNGYSFEFNEDEVSTLKTEKFADNRCRYIEDENINLDQIPELCLWLESIQI